ncbi:MAG: type VII toxin-antitoxin system MntA family adenylyltransferase antitoxin [Gemmatimonadota bacterium]
MQREMKPPSPTVSIERLRVAANEIGRELEVRLIILFGSTARNEAFTEDIDLAIVSRDELDTVHATNRFIQVLGVQEVDIADLRRADPLLMMFVAKDGLPLYEAESGAFARFCSLAVRRYADTRKFRLAEREEVLDFIGRTAERT